MKKFVLFLIVLVFLSCKKGIRDKNFKQHIGVYLLDVKRTNLDIYKKDSIKYKNVKIFFYKDSTFKMNKEVPFVLESCGKWISDGGDFESWNWLQYSSWLKDNRKLEIGKGNQFTLLYKDGNDSIFYINGATSKKDKKSIQEIYFIKQSEKIAP